MIREAIRAEMTRVGWTQAEVARMVQATQPDLSAYLAGKRDWGGEKLGRVLAALGLTVARTKTF